VSLQQTAKFQFSVRPNYGIRVDSQVDRQLPYCGELIASNKRAGGDRATHLIDNLPVHGHTSVQVKPEMEGRRWNSRTHFALSVL